MADHFVFTLDVEPVPASRARAKLGQRGGGYFTGKYKTFREEVAYCRIPALKLEGAIQIRAEFVCKRPQKPANPYPIGDIDNYEKALYDALEKAEVYTNDSQIVRADSYKRYAIDGETPRINVFISKEPVE